MVMMKIVLRIVEPALQKLFPNLVKFLKLKLTILKLTIADQGL
jgi:hypothetical protein